VPLLQKNRKRQTTTSKQPLAGCFPAIYRLPGNEEGLRMKDPFSFQELSFYEQKKYAMKKIIVFTYPFDKIEEIVDYSLHFARDLTLPVEFINVIEEPSVAPDPLIGGSIPPIEPQFETIPEELVGNRKRVLQKVLSIKNASMEIPVSYSYKVLTGTFYQLFTELTGRNDIQLVLVPNTGNSGSSDLITDMVEIIKQPVYSFPLGHNYHPIRKIVYATDYNPKDTATLKKTALLAQKLMAKLTVLHVCRNKKDSYSEELKNEGLQEKLNRLPHLQDVEVTDTQSSKIVKGIKAFSQRNYADLIVMLKENKSALAELFGKSTTKDLLQESPLPILIYNE
jgi:nucleotide-binding universal stress UspA family protein